MQFKSRFRSGLIEKPISKKSALAIAGSRGELALLDRRRSVKVNHSTRNGVLARTCTGAELAYDRNRGRYLVFGTEAELTGLQNLLDAGETGLLAYQRTLKPEAPHREDGTRIWHRPKTIFNPI